MASPPSIPQGLATRLGSLLTAVLGAAAIVSAILGGDNTPETLVAVGGATLTAVTVMAGRYLQAYALLKQPQTPAAGEAAARVVVCCCDCHAHRSPERRD